MDLANFPFDIQRCKFSIESCKIVCFYINSVVFVCLQLVCFNSNRLLLIDLENLTGAQKEIIKSVGPNMVTFFFQLESPIFFWIHKMWNSENSYFDLFVIWTSWQKKDFLTRMLWIILFQIPRNSFHYISKLFSIVV